MSDRSIAIVGTGPHPQKGDHDGFSMGYRHARSFRAVDGCRLTACADLDPGNAREFGAEFGLPDDRVYTDLRGMLDDAAPDVVAICTPPATHAALVQTCADHEAVRAIHCEKPMATTLGESRRLVEHCEDRDAQLTFNLQNRCSDAAAAVKRVVQEGAIGELERIEIGRRDLLQTGIHHFDVANFVLDDEPVAWVLGQIDYPAEHVWYTDMHAEAQGLGMWRYESGVYGYCSTGKAQDAVGPRTNRFIGTDGEIEFRLRDSYRIRSGRSAEWRTVEVGGPPAQEAAAAEVIRALTAGDESIIGARKALAATEIVFGIWESSRRRGRVEFPLEIEDNPLAAMVEGGDLPPDG